MPYLDFTVPAELDGLAARDCLRRLWYLSAPNLRALRERGGLTINDEPCPTFTRLSAHDRVRVDLSDAPARQAAVPTQPPKVLWEDGWFAVLDKPAGMATHASTFCPDAPTVHGSVAALWGERTVFHPVNRLDRPTSGAMCVARCGYMHQRLKELLHTDGFVRTYLCLTQGIPERERGRVELAVSRAKDSVIARTVGSGAPAVTDYRVLWREGERALVLCRPLTGRTHQIRLHMAALGCPILGDFLYGQEVEGCRCALHSAAVRILHPVTGQEVCAFAALPADMAAAAGERAIRKLTQKELFDV